MKTARERAEEKRQEKLEFVAEQVENGQLVIRQMTEEERKRYPPLRRGPNAGEGLRRCMSGRGWLRGSGRSAARPPRPLRCGQTLRPNDDTIVLPALEARIKHLEQLVEALQDSVHRESERHANRITELDARIQPAALGVALNRDARERGL